MAHYPAYGAQREGRVPGQPASVVMGGLDTISANSEVGQPHPGAPPVPADRARGPGEKLLGLSVWVQRLRGVPAGGVPAGGAGTPPNGMRVAEAQERPRAVPANVERLPPGVPLFGALREFGPRGGVPQSAGGRQSPDERPADEGSAHEGAESPRERKEEEEANDEPETPTSGPSPTPAPPLPNATNQARGSGPSTGGPVFVGGVRNSTDTASRSVEGPSTADGNPNPNPNPKPSSSSQQRSRGGGYGPSLASRRYGLAEALREQQEAAAVRRWMSKSESGSHAYKASNGTGASGGAGSRPSTEVGLPSPSVGAPLKQFAEAGPPEMAGGGGGRREQGGVENGFSARRNGVLQLDGEEARGRQGGAAEKQDGREKVYEEQANQPNAFGTGFGSFGSLNKDSGLPAGVRGVEGQPNGLGGKFKEAQEGEGKSLEGSGGSRGGARRGMGSWVERLGIGSGSRDAVNQAQKEGAVGKTNVVEGSGVGRASTAGGDLDMAGGGLGRSKDEAGGQTKAPSEGGAAASNGAAGRNSEGEGSAGSRKRGGKGFRPNGGLNFLPSFRMPPPLVIPGENQAPEPEVQDVLEAGGHALMETPPRTSAPPLSPWAIRLGLGGRGGAPANPLAEPPTAKQILGPSGEGFDPRLSKDENMSRGQPDDVTDPQRQEGRRRSVLDLPPGLENGLGGLSQRPPGNPFRFGSGPFGQSSPTEAGGFRRGFRDPLVEEQRFPTGQGLGFEGLERPVFHPGFGGGGPFQSRPFPGPQASAGLRSETPKETFRVPRSPTIRQGPFKLPPSHPTGAHDAPDPFNWSPKGEGFPAFPNPFAKAQPSTNADPNPNRINPFVAALQGNPSLSRSRNPDRFGARPPPHPRPFEDFGKWGAPPMQFGFPPGQGFFGRRSPDSSRGGSSTSPQEAAKGLAKPSLSSGSLQAGGRSIGGATSEGARPAQSGGVSLQGLGQKSMRARLDGVGGLGFRPEGFPAGGAWKPGVFREPRAVPSAHERQVSGDGSCSSFSRGGNNAPPRENRERDQGHGGANHSPLQTSPEALSKPTIPGGWEHPPVRANEARFPSDGGFGGAKVDAHAPGGASFGGERSRGGAGESGRRGFGSEFAAASPDAMRPFSYPSFQETRVARPGPVEGSGSAATKSVPLDLLRGGGADRAGSDSDASEQKGASENRAGSLGQQADSAGGSGPSSGSMRAGGRSSLGASGLPSPSNPSLGGSSESLLRDLFNPESLVEVQPLPPRRSSAQPLPSRSLENIPETAPLPHQSPFATSPRDQALGGGEGALPASWSRQQPFTRTENLSEGGRGRMEAREVGEEEREWKAESPDGVVPSGRNPSPSQFSPPAEQHNRSAYFTPLPSVNTHRRTHSRFSEGGPDNDGEVPSDSQLLPPQSAQISPPQYADAAGDRAVPSSKIVKTNRKGTEIARKGGDGLSDGFPQRRWFDRLNERERDGSPRTLSVNAAVDAAREGLGSPSPKGEAGTVDVNLDRMAAELAEAVAAYGRSTVEAAVRRHLRVAKLKRRADGPERTERTESEGAGTERTERTGRTGRTESEGAGTDWTNQTETTAQTGSEAERTEVDGTGAEHRNRRGEKRSRGGEEEQGDSRERGGGKRARPEVAGTEERIGGTGGGLKRVKAEVGEEEENPNCGRVESRGHFGAPSNRGVSERGIVDSTGQRKQEMGLTGSAQTEGGALHSDTLASRFFSNDDTVREPGGSVGLGSSRHQEDRLSRQTYRPFLAVPKPELESSLANGAPTLTVSKAELDSSPGGPFPVVHFAPLAGTSLENGPTGPAREGGLGQASPRLTPQTSDSSAAAGRCRSPSTEPFLKKEAAATVSH